MVGWHHQLNGYESEQAPGVGDGQGSLGCCSPWGRKELVGPKGRREEKGLTEDEMVGCRHRLDEREFEQAMGVGDGQGGLVCCSPWGCKESDTTEQLN